jgi:sugar lactone lactonase YvrE
MKSRLALWLGFAVTLWSPIARIAAQSYSFTTIAGLVGVSGTADGTNTDARFDTPAGLAVDNSGNVYVGDLLNHAIRKLTPVGTNWIVTTIAGLAGTLGSADGTNTDARFNRPNGVALDKAGNLFVVDHYNQTIRKVTPQGTNWVVTTIAGAVNVRAHDDGTNSDAHFYSPTGIAVDAAGHLFVTDSANFTIRGITPLGTNWVVTTLAGTALNYGFSDGMNQQAQFDYPCGIGVNSAGTLFVADWGNHAIRRITPQGNNWVVDTIAGFSGLMGHVDGPTNIASFNFPIDLGITSAGQIFVTDQSNDLIREIDPAGGTWMVSTVAGVALQAGSADGMGTNALFKRPWGMAIDSAGNLYIADYLNQTIRKGVQVTALAPALQIQVSGGQAILRWPSSAINFVLESSGTLGITAAWAPQTNGIAISGNNFVFTNAAGSPQAFYRLRGQSTQNQ